MLNRHYEIRRNLNTWKLAVLSWPGPRLTTCQRKTPRDLILAHWAGSHQWRYVLVWRSSGRLWHYCHSILHEFWGSYVASPGKERETFVDGLPAHESEWVSVVLSDVWSLSKHFQPSSGWISPHSLKLWYLHPSSATACKIVFWPN